VRIFYPFHPRAGQMVQVEHRKRFAGEDHLVVVQPDGTLALIPAWMSEETARSTAMTSSSCLSVDRLVELRVRLDALLTSSDGESAPHEGGDHAITPGHTSMLPCSRPSMIFPNGEGNHIGHDNLVKRQFLPLFDALEAAHMDDPAKAPGGRPQVHGGGLPSLAGDLRTG
jgi:hypothetical protein